MKKNQNKIFSRNKVSCCFSYLKIRSFFKFSEDTSIIGKIKTFIKIYIISVDVDFIFDFSLAIQLILSKIKSIVYKKFIVISIRKYTKNIAFDTINFVILWKRVVYTWIVGTCSRHNYQQQKNSAAKIQVSSSRHLILSAAELNNF